MLIEKIRNDLNESIKQKNDIKKETLRFMRAALQNAAIEKKKKDLTDEEVIQVLKRLSKQRKESIESFKKGNRPDLVKKEEEELAVLSKYLPEELPEKEIIELIVKAIEETEAQGPRDMGKVMKNVMAKTKGKADGKTVSLLVSRQLQKKEGNEKEKGQASG